MRKNNFVKRILTVALGHIITGIGIGIFIYSNLGVDPGSVLHSGVSEFFNISYGTASAINNLLILIVVLLIDKKYINIASFMGVIFIGYSADITQIMLQKTLSVELNMFFNILLVILGCIIMGVGIAMYTSGQLGISAIDMPSEVISEKSGYDYKKVRIITDVLYVAIGYILGGQIGLGTIISALLIGPSIGISRRYIG